MKFLIAIFLTLFAFCTYAQENHAPGDGHDHSETVCSSINSQVCAHLRFLKPLNVKEEGEFILHVMTPNNQVITDLKVSLWMDMNGHGHESAPVEILPLGDLHYKIQNAWFVMEGHWLVKTQFKLNNETHIISIPVEIAAQLQNFNVTDLSQVRKTLFEQMKNTTQTVASNEKYIAVGLKPQIDKKYAVQVQSLQNPENIQIISTKNNVVDIKLMDEVVYILTATTIEVWDLKAKSSLAAYNTYPDIESNVHWRQAASGFILIGDTAVISHGTLGMTVVNLKNGEFIKIIKMPTVSAAQDIDLINPRQAIVAVDNDAEGSFCGLYILDLNTYTVTKKIKIDNPFPSSLRVLSGNRLMLVYFNAIWKFDLNNTLTSAEAEPNRRAWKFPGLNSVDMQGKVFFDDKYLYANFSILDEKTQTFVTKPIAVDLDILKLK